MLVYTLPFQVVHEEKEEIPVEHNQNFVRIFYLEKTQWSIFYHKIQRILVCSAIPCILLVHYQDVVIGPATSHLLVVLLWQTYLVSSALKIVGCPSKMLSSQ